MAALSKVGSASSFVFALDAATWSLVQSGEERSLSFDFIIFESSHDRESGSGNNSEMKVRERLVIFEKVGDGSAPREFQKQPRKMVQRALNPS